MPGFTNFGGGPTGQALTSPQVPAAGVAPTDPSQVGLWQKFQRRMQDDPNLRMAMLTTGLNLLRSPQAGQNNFDVFANATTTGVGTLDQLRQRDISNERLDRKEGLDERRTVATESNAAAVTERTDIARGSAEANVAAEATRKEEAEARLEIMRETNRIRREEAENRTATGTTGVQERFVESIASNLQAAFPDKYKGPEGQAQAFLDAQIRSQQVSDPDRYRGQLVDIVGLMQFDSTYDDLSLPEKFAIAQEILPQNSGVVAPEGGGGGAGADPLEGTTITHPVHGVGTVKAEGEDRYTVTFPTGTVTVNGAQVRAQQGTGAN